MENRRSQRLKCTALGQVRHQSVTYRIRVENVSRGGALLTSDDCLMLLPEERCTLLIELPAEDARITANIEVVHAFFSMLGVKFLSFEQDGEQVLAEWLKRLSAQQESDAATFA